MFETEFPFIRKEMYKTMDGSTGLTLVKREGEIFYILPDGRKHGQYRRFLTFGKKKTLVETKDYWRGKLHGEVKNYHEDKILWSVQEYSFGKPHGKYMGYYADGKLAWESNYEDGVYHGVKKAWWPSGIKSKKEHYFRGDLHGISRSWNHDGKILNTASYSYGRCIRSSNGEDKVFDAERWREGTSCIEPKTVGEKAQCWKLYFEKHHKDEDIKEYVDIMIKRTITCKHNDISLENNDELREQFMAMFNDLTIMEVEFMNIWMDKHKLQPFCECVHHVAPHKFEDDVASGDDGL